MGRVKSTSVCGTLQTILALPCQLLNCVKHMFAPLVVVLDKALCFAFRVSQGNRADVQYSKPPYILDDANITSNPSLKKDSNCFVPVMHDPPSGFRNPNSLENVCSDFSWCSTPTHKSQRLDDIYRMQRSKKTLMPEHDRC